MALAKISMFIPNISASDAKFENPLDDPESILLRGSQLKNELIWPRRLGCRGSAIDLAAAHLVIRALLYTTLRISNEHFLCQMEIKIYGNYYHF